MLPTSFVLSAPQVVGGWRPLSLSLSLSQRTAAPSDGQSAYGPTSGVQDKKPWHSTPPWMLDPRGKPPPNPAVPPAAAAAAGRPSRERGESWAEYDLRLTAGGGWRAEALAVDIVKVATRLGPAPVQRGQWQD